MRILCIFFALTLSGCIGPGFEVRSEPTCTEYITKGYARLCKKLSATQLTYRCVHTRRFSTEVTLWLCDSRDECNRICAEARKDGNTRAEK